MNSKLHKNLKFKLDGLTISANIEEPVFTETEPNNTLIQNFHYHVIYELFIMDEKPLTVYTQDGTSVYKSCIVCIPPFFKHRTYRQSGLRILFTFDKNTTNNDFSKFMSSFFSEQKPVIIKTNKSLFFYASQLSSLFSIESSLVNEIAVSLLKLIFYHLFSDNHELKKSINKKEILTTNESYLPSIDNMINDFSNNINLQAVADALGLSTKQTSRIIKKNYKKTLSQLICEKRLSVAAELLLKSDKTVTEIVEYINFPSESYFYHKFKEFFGYTPLKYKSSFTSNKS